MMMAPVFKLKHRQKCRVIFRSSGALGGVETWVTAKLRGFIDGERRQTSWRPGRFVCWMWVSLSGWGIDFGGVSRKFRKY